MDASGDRLDPTSHAARAEHVVATAYGRITLVVESHGAAMAKALAVLSGAAIEQVLQTYFPEV